MDRARTRHVLDGHRPLFKCSSMALSLFSILVSRSRISLSIRRLSSLREGYWFWGLRGEGSGSIGLGFKGSNGRRGSIAASWMANVRFDSFSKLLLRLHVHVRVNDHPKYFRTILTPTSLATHFSPLNFTAPNLSRLARCSPSFSAGNPFSLWPG